MYEWQAVAVARFLAGRARQPLPSVAEQLEWERRRVVARGEGKNFYAVGPDFEEYFELLRAIAGGEPAPGNTGRVLPAFDKKWLDVWAGMVATKIGGWQRKRKRAVEEERRKKGESGEKKDKQGEKGEKDNENGFG